MANQRGYRTISLNLTSTTKYGDSVPIRASARVADALEDITANASLYDGVKLTQVLEAAYVQGRKDGARAVFERLDGAVRSAKDAITHRAVGRPKKGA